MKNFFMKNGDVAVELFCYGDEKGLCATCKARFWCYTGELPDTFRASIMGKCRGCSTGCAYVRETTECGIFGKIKGLIQDGESKGERRRRRVVAVCKTDARSGLVGSNPISPTS